MKLVYDRARINAGVRDKVYDERGLTISKSGRHRYPSKQMFVDFLRQYADVKGTAEIWSMRDITDGTVVIHVEVRYKVPTKEQITQ